MKILKKQHWRLLRGQRGYGWLETTMIMLCVVLVMGLAIPLLSTLAFNANDQIKLQQALRYWLDEGYAAYADPSGDFHIASGDLYVSGDIYGATGRTATYVVASSDAPANWKAQANLTLTGTNDQTLYNAALASVDDLGGGVIMNSPGNFNFTNNLYIPENSNLIIEGQGNSSIFNFSKSALAGKFNTSALIIGSDSGTAYSNIGSLTIRNLKFKGVGDAAGYLYGFMSSWTDNDDGQVNGNITIDHVECESCGLWINNVDSGVATLSYNYVHDILSPLTNDQALGIRNSKTAIMTNNHAENVPVMALQAISVDRTVQNNNIIINSGSATGSQSLGANDCKFVEIVGNTATADGNSIVIENCIRNIVISGNTIEGYNPSVAPTAAYYYNGATYTDLTSAPFSLTTSDSIIVGYSSKVRKIFLTMGGTVNAVNASFVLDAYDGASWQSSLLPCDGTRNTTSGATLSRTGAMHITGDGRCAASTINGIASTYWYRLTPSTNLTANVIVSAVAVESYSTGAGIYVWNSTTNPSYKPNATNVIVTGNVINNFALGVVLQDIADATVNGNKITDIKERGITLTKSSGVVGQRAFSIVNNDIFNYGITAAWQAAISCASFNGTETLDILSNTIDSYYNVNIRGITGNNGSQPLVRIINNKIASSITPVYQVGSGAIIRDNTNYITENSGTGLGTGSQQTVAHGLSYTPSKKDIGVWSDNITAGVWQTANPNSTNIYVTCNVSGSAWHWATVGK